MASNAGYGLIPVSVAKEKLLSEYLLRRFDANTDAALGVIIATEALGCASSNLASLAETMRDDYYGVRAL